MEVLLHSFLTSVLKGSGQLQAPATLTRSKMPYLRWVGSRASLDTTRTSLARESASGSLTLEPGSDIFHHTHEWIPKLCSYISVSRIGSLKQVAAPVIILDECGVFGRKRKNRKRREIWATKWLLGRDRYTHLNLLNFIRNDSPEDYKNYLRMSDENVQYLIAKVKPLIAKKDIVMRVWLGTSHTRTSQ